MSDVVYILGAGFSRDAGAPKQDEILPSLFSNDFASHLITPHRDAIKRFLSEVFSLDCDDENGLIAFKLEDVFTILDRCLINQESFKNFDRDKIE
jgi:hypothetical protein